MPDEKVCPRCGYKTKTLRLFREHLNRKFICQAIVSDVLLDDLKLKYDRNVSCDYTCERCQNKFMSRSGYYAHKSRCGTSRLDNIEKMLEKILKLLSNKQEEVIIKDFGQEDIISIIDNTEYMSSCFSERGIINFMKKVWFDNQAHANFRVDNNEIEYYQFKRWIKCNWDNHLCRITDFIGSYYQLFLEKHPIIKFDDLNIFMNEIGNHLEWDLSHDGYDFVIKDLDENIKMKFYKKLKKEILLASQ